jgi:hypothetical protein
MPNFWTKAGQFISEAISDNKTKDEDYQLLCNQMIKTESGINSLKNILKNYNAYSDPFCKYIKTMNDSLYQIYKDSPLITEIEHINFKHELILKEMDNIGKIITKLYSKTSEWDTIFEKAKELRKVREEKRKNFDHYEQKLLKIEGDQNKKKNTDLLIRNQEKYSKALKEYLEISEKSFEVIKNSIKLSWELANPILGELFKSEKNLFEKISSHLTDFGNVTNDFQEIMDKTFNPENVEETEKFYDPKKCIRSKTLMKRNDDNFNYVHNFARNTSTCAKGFKDREIKFMEIKDDFSIYYQE